MIVTKALIAGLLLLAASGAADASLIGDTVTIGRFIDGNVIGDGSCCGPFDVVVEAGAGDTTPVSGGNNLYVNVEADRVRFEFGPEAGDGGGLPDHEILVEGLDWVGSPSTVITGIDLVTNTYSGFITESLFSFGDHSIGLQVGSLVWTGSATVGFAEVIFQTSAAPEPSTYLLVGLGLLGLIGLRRRKRA